MLDDISKYKKIRSNFLSARMTIDGQVFGLREQKLIKRNEDVVFLTEAAAICAGARDQSVFPAVYPFPDDIELPRPELDKYVDDAKLLSAAIDFQNIVYKTGGEDPDIENLRTQFLEATNTRDTAVRTAGETYETAVRQIEDAAR